MLMSLTTHSSQEEAVVFLQSTAATASLSEATSVFHPSCFGDSHLSLHSPEHIPDHHR